jgi:glycosyltransferase involved in cell wall biosynthesis
MNNILFFSEYADNHTGSPKALCDLASNLNRTTYELSLIIHRDGLLADDFRNIGGAVMYKQSLSLSVTNFFIYLKSIREFMSLYRNNHIDLLHFNGTGWRESAVVAAWLANIPVLLNLHNPYPQKDIRGNFNFALADKIIIVSESMRDNFKNHPGILRKTICIHNGVNLSRFTPAQSLLRSTLSINSNLPIIGFVGQMCQRKGVDLLVRSAAAIRPFHPDALFVLVGIDGVGEEGYTESMKQLAAELGVLDRFVFLGMREDIPEVMNAFDMLVVPSRAEPFGKVIIEAMACGKCVVAARVGGIPEIIEDGFNGLLIPAEDSAALGRAILRLLDDERLRRSLAIKGLQTAREKFSIEALVNKTQYVYQELLQKRKVVGHGRR